MFLQWYYQSDIIQLLIQIWKAADVRSHVLAGISVWKNGGIISFLFMGFPKPLPTSSANAGQASVFFKPTPFHTPCNRVHQILPIPFYFFCVPLSIYIWPSVKHSEISVRVGGVKRWIYSNILAPNRLLPRHSYTFSSAPPFLTK